MENYYSSTYSNYELQSLNYYELLLNPVLYLKLILIAVDRILEISCRISIRLERLKSMKQIAR